MSTSIESSSQSWCSVAVSFVLLAGLVHLTNVVYLSSKGLLRLQPPTKTISEVNGTSTISIKSSSDSGRLTDIVWLMSFPNSGTSYTIVNTEQLTGMTTATNYGVPEVHDDPPILVRPDQAYSPFWHYDALSKPRRALTKTHCNTVLDYDEFEKGCRTIAMNNSSGKPEEYQYDASLVKAAVHLIRHPLDNLVSRKHHMLRREVNTGILSAQQAVSRFPDTPQGLRDWCDYKLNKTNIWQLFPPHSLEKIAKDLSQVPCYGDLMYYLQWHNLATKTLAAYHIPVFALYYEDYARDYNATIRDLYEFVFSDVNASRSQLKTNGQQAPMILDWNNHVPFQDTKVYHDFFTTEQQQAVAMAVSKLSSSSAWELIKRYYPDAHG